MQKEKKTVTRKTVPLNTTIPPKTDEKMGELIEGGHYVSKSDVVVAGVDVIHARKTKESEARR